MQADEALVILSFAIGPLSAVLRHSGVARNF